MNATSAASNVISLDPARRRDGKVVAAAQVISIDYKSIVENAVAGLAYNTPDARREVYVQARNIVHRHLTLMRLPEPIVELERLALDLTIRRVERHWRARQVADALEREIAAAPRLRRAVPRQHAKRGGAGAVRVIGPDVRRLAGQKARALRAALSKPLQPLSRALLSPIALMVVLPIVLVTIVLVFLVDNGSGYRALAGSAPIRWLSRFEPASWVPWRSGAKPALRIASTKEEGPGGTVAAKSAVRSSPGMPGESPPYRGATRIRPIRADLTALIATKGAALQGDAILEPAPSSGAVPPSSVAAPAMKAASVSAPGDCDNLPSASDSITCAIGTYGKMVLGPNSHARWFAGYAAINDAAGSHPVFQSVASGSWPSATATDAVPVEAPQPSAPIIRTANAKVMALIESGRKWSNRGDLERAVHDFTEAIRLDPKYPDSYEERGQALFKMGETDRAIADYSAAIQRDPQFGAALRSRGMAYLYRGTQDRALADLTHAIDLAESDPTTLAPIELFYAHRSRSQIYSAMQQYAREIDDCTAVIDSYAHNPVLAQDLKQNYAEAGAANVIATVYRQRATAYIRLSNWNAAIADLTAAVPLSYDHGYAALVDRSKLHEGLGQREEAVADLQSALAARPGSEEVRIALRRLGGMPRSTAPVGAL